MVFILHWLLGGTKKRRGREREEGRSFKRRVHSTMGPNDGGLFIHQIPPTGKHSNERKGSKASQTEIVVSSLPIFDRSTDYSELTVVIYASRPK